MKQSGDHDRHPRPICRCGWPKGARPPLTSLEARVQTFKETLEQEQLRPETLRQYLDQARLFMVYLGRQQLLLERATSPSCGRPSRQGGNGMPIYWPGAIRCEGRTIGQHLNDGRIGSCSHVERTQTRWLMSIEIEKLIKAENWSAARQAIRLRLRSSPDDHWLLTRLGLTYYEQRRCRLALKYHLRALEKMPNCPLALWDYARGTRNVGSDRRSFECVSPPGPSRRVCDCPRNLRRGASVGPLANCRLSLPDGALLQGEAATGHGKEVATEPSLTPRAWVPVHLPFGYRPARDSRTTGRRGSTVSSSARNAA
jgi:tetratricopeptide (TPR) repeat protein